MSRRSASRHGEHKTSIDPAMSDSHLNASYKAGSEFQTEIKHAASFLVWPVIGFVGAITGGWLALDWLAPLGMGGLFCHYWLDGRIWTRRSFKN
jgi:hypothetical protein